MIAALCEDFEDIPRQRLTKLDAIDAQSSPSLFPAIIL